MYDCPVDGELQKELQKNEERKKDAWERFAKCIPDISADDELKVVEARLAFEDFLNCIFYRNELIIRSRLR